MNNSKKIKKMQKYLCLFLAVLMIVGVVAGALTSFAAEGAPTLILDRGHKITNTTVGGATIEVEKYGSLPSSVFTTEGQYTFKITDITDTSGTLAISEYGRDITTELKPSLSDDKTILIINGVKITKKDKDGKATTAFLENDEITLNFRNYTASVTSTPAVSNKKITYSDSDREVPIITYNRRYDLHMTVTDVDIELQDIKSETATALLTGGSFKYDEDSDVRVSARENSKGFLEFDVSFYNVKYTGKGNSISSRILYEANYNKVDYNLDVSFEEYRFREYVAPSSSEPEEEEDKKEPKLKPHIIVDSYNYGGMNVVAGSTFDLKLNIKNTSTDQDLKNIVMTISSGLDSKGTTAFSIASASNMIYIDDLKKGESVEKIITINVAATADPKPNIIKVDFTFEYMPNANDKAFLNSSDTVDISIPVSQIDRFTINYVDAPSTLYEGEEYPVSASLINKGKSDISNVNVEFKTEDGEQKSTKYLGNIAPGEAKDAEFFVTGQVAGELKGLITVTYEDSALNIKTLTKEVIINVEGNNDYIPDFNPGENENPGGFEPDPTIPVDVKPDNTIKYVLITLGVIICALSAFTTVMKIKVNRSELADEDI